MREKGEREKDYGRRGGGAGNRRVRPIGAGIG
jgi:hypothetical protein